jgi:epoxyqueuosine reductase
VGLGNAPYQHVIVETLQQRLANSSELVAEHIDWAIKQQLSKSQNGVNRLTRRLIRSIEKGLPRDA